MFKIRLACIETKKYIVPVLIMLIPVFYYLVVENDHEDHDDIIEHSEVVGQKMANRLRDKLVCTEQRLSVLCDNLKESSDSKEEYILNWFCKQLKDSILIEKLWWIKDTTSGEYTIFEIDANGDDCFMYRTAQLTETQSEHFDIIRNKWQKGEVVKYELIKGKLEALTWCVKPFKNSAGVNQMIALSYSSSYLFHKLNNWQAGRLGYAYLMNKAGYFLAHPYNDRRSLETLGNDCDEPVLIELAKEMKKLNSCFPGEYYHENTVSKANCWEKIFPISTYEIYLGISVTDQLVYSSPAFFNQKRRQKISNSVLLLSATLLLLLFILNRYVEYRKWLSLGIFILCGIMIFQILLIYRFNNKYPNMSFSDIEIDSIHNKEEKRWNRSMLLDGNGVQLFTNKYLNKTDSGKKNNFHIMKTGIYLQTIRFNDIYSTNISGVVWQRCTVDTLSKIRPGIDFPDAEQKEIALIDTLRFDYMNGKRVYLHRWFFNISVCEPFNYSQYPFDRNDLYLRLSHSSFNENIMLIPDLNSYLLLHPSFKPGLDGNINIPGWNIEGSYFSYKTKNYTSNFGYQGNVAKEDVPELHFNMLLERDYVDPIITRIIPLLVLLIMVYSILYIGSKQDALDVVIACSGLFFVAVFEHVNLRRSLSASGISYLGYYYFTSYILLMLISFSAISGSRRINIPGGNQTLTEHLKRLFWLVATLLILICTVLTFW
ncbi:hypothetical protein EMN47_16725 [Prolixibacteraceae bacterium JC049]|nr:hypothetical protein [Prolixibacteraceae bacterium JC049]